MAGNTLFAGSSPLRARPGLPIPGTNSSCAWRDGDLPEAAFRHYLIQDYLFLLHFSRAWGLAIYKSDTLAEMRRAQGLVAATLDVEIGLHVEYCRSWGIDDGGDGGRARGDADHRLYPFRARPRPRRRPA